MSQTLTIPARNFLKHSTKDLWDLLEGDFKIEFVDGIVDTNEREVIYSSYVWEMIRRYPDTPLLKKHHVRVMLGSKELMANAHLKLINEVLWSVHDAYEYRYEDKQVLRDELARLAYEITNTMYNELSVRCEPFVTSLDITDFTAITTYPAVDEATANMPPTEEGIRQVHKLIEDLIDKDPVFKSNPLAVAIRTGIARKGQALQCLGPRGFITDMDSNLFRNPVTTSYVQGIRTLHDSMIESRSAAKSLINSTKPLQDSEYFSRRQQLICMNVKHLHPGDCGSQQYLMWPVRGVRFEGTTKVSDGDLKTLAGKYYMDDASKTLRMINESDEFLIGQTLKLRSAVAGCQHPDPYGICSMCYGEGSLAIPANSNLGHIACVNMTALIGQNILSLKHYDSSSVVEGIVLKPMEAKYLKAQLNGNSYYLNDKLKNKQVKILILTSDAPGLPNINLTDKVEQFNVSRISEFPMILLIVSDAKGGTEMVPLDVKVNHRNSSMTHDFLRHIKKHNYKIINDDKGGAKYEFDMTGWDFDQPLFVLPMSHINQSDHQAEIASLLEATAAELEKRNSVVDPKDMLMELHDLVNRRLNVSLACLEIILYSSMVVSATKNNYDLPKPWTENGIGVMRLLLSNRSKAAQMGYQNHHNEFADPASYVQRKRPDHIFDGILMPEVFNTTHKFLSGT